MKIWLLCGAAECMHGLIFAVRCHASIHRRLGIAGSIMAQLDKVWHQQRLSLSIKLRIYTSLVQSVVLLWF